MWRSALPVLAAMTALGSVQACGASTEPPNSEPVRSELPNPAIAAPPETGTKPKGPRCGSDDDCALARFDPDTRSCCSCNFVAILSIDQTAFQERCADATAPCVQSCLQNPKTRAVCADGVCAVRP